MEAANPSWSASIRADRSGEDMVASEAIGRFLERRTEDEIHRSANQLLRLARHLDGPLRRNLALRRVFDCQLLTVNC